MTLTKNGKTVGRPLKNIDPKQVEMLASLGCSVEEIASVVDSSTTSLWKRFGTIISRGHNNQKMSLRKFQFDAAKRGNPALLIWLGKQYLKQRDSPVEVNQTVKGAMVHLNVDNVESDTVIEALLALDKLKAEANTIDVEGQKQLEE